MRVKVYAKFYQKGRASKPYLTIKRHWNTSLRRVLVHYRKWFILNDNNVLKRLFPYLLHSLGTKVLFLATGIFTIMAKQHVCLLFINSMSLAFFETKVEVCKSTKTSNKGLSHYIPTVGKLITYQFVSECCAVQMCLLSSWLTGSHEVPNSPWNVFICVKFTVSQLWFRKLWCYLDLDVSLSSQRFELL